MTKLLSFLALAGSLLCLSLPVAAQTTIKVNGTVLAGEADPLPGATVAVKGSTRAVLTDVEGNYTIEVPNRRTVLVFSFIGFATQEIVVGDQNNIDVTLTEEANTLDEVVVSAFGSQRKVSIVGAITSVRPEALQAGVARSVSNNLAGQLAGVIGIQRSGEVGKDQSDIWVRGMNTFVGADLMDRRTQAKFTKPLVLVDGIERSGSLNDMDPAEIESFSILKDASATAMYGVRGANGVILINTKRGVVGKPRISVRTEYAISQPTQFPEFLSAVPYMETMNKIRTENGLTPFYDSEVIEKTRNRYDPELYPDTDWIDTISNDFASSSRTNISITGGSEVLRYALVASYLHEDGIIANDPNQEWDSSLRLNRYNIRSNVDVNITKTTLARVNIGGYLQDRKGPAWGLDGIYYVAFRTPPTMPVVYNDGKLPRSNNSDNPWAILTQRGYGRNFQSSVESLFSIEQDFKFLLPGLKLKASFSFDNYSDGYVHRFKEPTYYFVATERDDFGNVVTGEPYTVGPEDLGNQTKVEFGYNTTYMEANLSYTNTFGEHYVDAMLLLNRREYSDIDPIPFRNQGMAGRLSYNYGRRYVAEFNFGYNGSENLSKDKRYGFFPSIAAGWVLSEEPFMESVKNILNMVKIRGSYGLVGNDQIVGRRFAYLATIDKGLIDENGTLKERLPGYSFGETANRSYSGLQEGDFATPELRWETVAKTNVGVDLGLYNCFNLQADFFYERRYDIFMQRVTATPSEAGIVSAIYANYGVVVNRGIDLTIDYGRRFGTDWEVMFRGTFTYAKNKILEQDEAAATLGTWRSTTGHPVGTYTGFVAEGLYTYDDFDANGNLKEGLPRVTISAEGGAVQPGDIKFKDMDGNGIIDWNDRGPLDDRTREPKLVYGFGWTVRYKNLDFSAFFQGIGDSYILFGHRDMYFFPGGGEGLIGNILTNVDDRWTPENPRQDAFYPRLSWGMHRLNSYDSTWWLKNVSYLRMRNIEIGYTLPQKLLSKVQIKSARIFIGGNNLLTFSGFKFWDPEIGDQAADYPPMKSIQLGIDVTF
jgi:TonB-linked SusC/RagA family outer membrane protein